MKIKILNVTSNRDEIINDIWKISRPNSNIKQNPLEIDAPINDFVHLILHIKCSILEREIFTSMRGVVIWAQTSRVNDPFKWDIDPQISVDKSILDNLFITMKKASKTESQDNFRMYMPLAASTEFSCKISTRSLFKLAGYFEYLSIYQKYFKTSSIAINNIIDIDNMKNYNKIYLLDNTPKIKSGRIGDYIIVSVNESLAFRAQVIRHSNIFVSDGLFDLIVSSDIWSKHIGTKIPIQMCASKSSWSTIIRNRSCWMSQYSLWINVFVEIYEYINISEDILPCTTICPYNIDAELRYTGFDPGAPCPKHAILTNKKLSDDDMTAIDKQYKDERRPKFWENIICKAIK